jgi:predicted deacylase
MMEYFEPFMVEKGNKKSGYVNVINNLAARIDMPICVVNGSKNGPTFTVTGGLFPTEHSGVEAAGRLYQLIDPKDLSGRIVIVPVVNMPCLQFRTPWLNLAQSTSPMDGLSINYVFPGDPQGTVTRVVAHKLFNEIILKSDYHVDLRGGDLSMSHLTHTIYPKIGKNIDKTCEEMAKVAGFEYVLPGTPDIGHTGKGTLVYETVTRGVPSIITESGLGYKIQPSEHEIRGHIQAVTNILKQFNMFEGKPIKPKNQRFLDMTWIHIRALVAGIFHAIADQGDVVKKDELIGKIMDLDGTELSRVSASIDGVIHCMRVRRLVYPGDVLYTILKILEPTGW